LGGLGEVDFDVDVEEEGVLWGETGGEKLGRALWKGFLLMVRFRGSNVGRVKFICVGVMLRRGEERSEDEAVGVSSPLCSDEDEDDHRLGEGTGLVHAYEVGSCRLNMDVVCDNCGGFLEGELRSV